MRVVTVTGVPYNARCDYSTRTIELNIDPIYTYEGLRHLAVHEGYPGHYVQFKLREAGYYAGTAPADGLLSLVNTASSSPFEGIADNGLHVLGWNTSDDDRLSALISRYRLASARAELARGAGARLATRQRARRRRGLGRQPHGLHRRAATQRADLVVLVGGGVCDAGVGARAARAARRLLTLPLRAYALAADSGNVLAARKRKKAEHCGTGFSL